MGKAIRSSLAWKGAVLAISPAFHWAWKNVFNYRERMLYLRTRIPKREDAALRREGIRIVKGDAGFSEFAARVRAGIPDEVLAQHERELQSNPNEEAFFGDILPRCEAGLKLDILKFALGDRILGQVLPYFGIMPKLNSIMILHNVVRPGERAAGSMLWHRDSDHYRALNLFMCISEVDDGSGAYSAITAKGVPFEAVIPFEFENEQSLWKRCRIPDEVMDEYVSREYRYKLTGKPGTAAFVDPGSLYHKGGHCTERPRLMLQISFATNTPGPTKGIGQLLGLDSHPGFAALLDTPEKRFLASSDSDGLLRKLGLRNPTHRIGKGILHYDMRKGPVAPARRQAGGAEARQEPALRGSANPA